MSYENPRIQLTDTYMDAIMKMCGGNPGALNALMALSTTSPHVDPDSAFAELSPLLSLDTLDIYESEIWILFKDVCEHDVVNVHTVLRANQLGMISDREIKAAIEGHKKIDLDSLKSQVKERLPNFNLEYRQETPA